ncbi:MAG TPA: hypothetical protein VHD88_05885 [Pyrinomonadaceae bacterium]|nr:hypothetical protein [Pyrinomonadaceae bacterium]
MGDLTDIAREIINTTRVVTDAANASPGKPVNVTVLPGLSPQVPTNFNLTGTLGGTVGGALSGVLSALVNSVKIKVKYSVTKGGAAVSSSEFKVTPPLANPSDFSELNSLNVAFLLKPPIGDDTELVDAFEYKIVVDLSVDVEGHEVHTGSPPNPPPIGAFPSIEIPVAMPALGIPALLLLSKHSNFNVYDGDNPGQLFVMVRGSSPLRELGTLVATINRLMSTIKTLQDVLGWGAAFADFTGALTLASTAINTIPTIFFSLGNAHDLGDFGGFDDEASSSLLIGTAGTQVTLYSQEDFDKETGTIENDEHSVFTAADVGAGLGITTGVGVDKRTSFGDWDTDAGDGMNDSAESVRFGGI